MDFSELTHQSEIRDSLDKILLEQCTPEKLKEFDVDLLCELMKIDSEQLLDRFEDLFMKNMELFEDAR